MSEILGFVATASRPAENRGQAANEQAMPDAAAAGGPVVEAREELPRDAAAVAAEAARQRQTSADATTRPDAASRQITEAEPTAAPPEAARDPGAPPPELADALRLSAAPGALTSTLAAALPIRSVDAGLWLGASSRTLPDLELVGVELVPAAFVVDALPGRIAVRSRYRTATGEQVTLLQQYAGPAGPLAGLDAPDADLVERSTAALRAETANRAADAGGLSRAADALAAAALFDALELPTTVRDPDGLVTHTWRDGDYLLRISANLEADAVRGLASRVR